MRAGEISWERPPGRGGLEFPCLGDTFKRYHPHVWTQGACSPRDTGLSEERLASVPAIPRVAFLRCCC